MLSPGDVVAGKYRIERPLGEGGMGAVYVAINEKLRKRVALKLLRREVANVPGAAERFTREAIAASSAKHPGIIEIYDADSHEGQPWIAMELLEGESLSSRMERGRVPLPEVLEIVCEALAALAHVHRAGIIHRDLKPDNLFLEELPEGGRRVKILDFGIAASSRSELARVTQTGMAIGTPAYLAPEQAAGQSDLDARVDVYAMGVILFELITGHLPYEASSLGEMVMLMFTRGPSALGRAVPGLPPALSSIVDMCLAVDRDHRVQSAESLRRELELARHRVGALVLQPPTHEVPIARAIERAGGFATREISHAPTMHATPVSSANGLSPHATPAGSASVPSAYVTPPGYSPWAPATSVPGARPDEGHEQLAFARTAHATPGSASSASSTPPGPAPGYWSTPSFAPSPSLQPVTHQTPAAPAALGTRVASASPQRIGLLGLTIALGLAFAALGGLLVLGGALYLASSDGGETTRVASRPAVSPVTEAPAPPPTPTMEPLAPIPVPTPEEVLPSEDVPAGAGAGDTAPEPARPLRVPVRRQRHVARRLEPEPAPSPVAPPPLAHDGTPRPLDNATIVRVLRANEAALDRCYFEAYPDRPRPPVRTEVDLTISSSGRVTESSIVSPRPLLDACVRRVLSGVRFPAHPHSTRARFPMTFHDEAS